MKIQHIALVLLLSFFTASAHAQLGALKKMGGGNKSDETNQGISAESSQDQLVRDFTQTLTLVMTAQSRLQDALGNSEESAKLQLAIEDLKGECAKKCLERSVEVSAAANDSIADKMSEQQALDAERKAVYVTAIPPYIQGTLSARQLASTATNWTKQSTEDMKNAGMMGAASLKRKLEIGTYVATKMPGLLKQWTSSTQMVLSFAKTNDVDLDSVEGVNDFDFGA